MPGTIRLARCTCEVALTAIIRSSSSSAVSMKAPPIPMPAFSAAAASGRPVSWTALHTASTPS